jgi:hypothetical protein
MGFGELDGRVSRVGLKVSGFGSRDLDDSVARLLVLLQLVHGLLNHPLLERWVFKLAAHQFLDPGLKSNQSINQSINQSVGRKREEDWQSTEMGWRGNLTIVFFRLDMRCVLPASPMNRCV